jgi:hypothetical protein
MWRNDVTAKNNVAPSERGLVSRDRRSQSMLLKVRFKRPEV